MFYIPKGLFRSEEDDAALRRKKLAEALRRGDQISVAPSGEVMTQEEKNADPDAVSITVPEGKLAETIFSCRKCGRIYKSEHSGICPKCGGKLDAERVDESHYNSALA